jgi:hypothetical protein
MSGAMRTAEPGNRKADVGEKVMLRSGEALSWICDLQIGASHVSAPSTKSSLHQVLVSSVGESIAVLVALEYNRNLGLLTLHEQTAATNIILRHYSSQSFETGLLTPSLTPSTTRTISLCRSSTLWSAFSTCQSILPEAVSSA